MGKKMVIVGAGIAGLSTGFYARLNGFETLILERDKVPGGLCAAWTRKGYTFDMSMHLLTSSKRGPYRQMWEELGVVGEREFHYHDSLYTIEGRDKSLELSTDREKLKATLIALSPDDAKLSTEFVDLFCGPNLMAAASLKAPELFGPLDYLRMGTAALPMMPIFRKYGKTTIQDFASRFRDPFLRDAIRFSIDSPGWRMQRFPISVMAGFARSAVTEAGVPIGGSNRAIRDIAERFEQMGGELRYKSGVADIIVEDNRATGVRLESGDEIGTDIVVWAADGHHLIFDILGGEYMSEEIRKMYTEWIPVQPLVQITMGVNRDMSREPYRLIRELAKPIEIAGEQHRWMSVISHAFDPTSAPKGKTALEVWYATHYDYWKELSKERTRYKAEKARVAELSLDALEERWPGIRSQVEVVEVATPATYVRYTGNWQGSPDGWYVTIDNVMKRSLLRTLPGLSGLFTVGQWTAPYTGTVIAATSGRQLVEILCRKMHQPFVTCAKRLAATA